MGYLTEAPEALTGRTLILVGCGPTGPDLGRKSSEACRREPRNARRSCATSLLKVLLLGYFTEAAEELTKALTGRTLILLEAIKHGRLLLGAVDQDRNNTCQPPI